MDRMSELFGYQNTDDLLPPIKSGKGNRNIANNVNKPSSYPKDISKSDKAKPEGKVEKCRYRNYYDTDDTITTAQIIDPHDEDNPNYNRERIFEILERNAEIIYVMNDGADILYVIVSHEGGQNFARERPIYAGEHKTFFNVYELRLRSPTQGLAYRVTEYPICCVKTTSTVTGTVTANAGINLNTSALALEAGNLANIKTNTDKLDVNLSTVLLDLTSVIDELNTRLRELSSQQAFVDTAGRLRVIPGTFTTESAIALLNTLGSIGSSSTTSSTYAQYSAALFNWQLSDIDVAVALRPNILTS